MMSRRQRRELLRLADPDRNGEIDIDELADFLYDIEVSRKVLDSCFSRTGRIKFCPDVATLLNSSLLPTALAIIKIWIFQTFTLFQ